MYNQAVENIRSYVQSNPDVVIIATVFFVVLSFVNSVVSYNRRKPVRKGDEPQLNYGLLNAFNYIFMGIFIASVSYASNEYRKHGEVQHAPILAVIWVCCLVYFFGFFGLAMVSDSVVSPLSSNDLAKLGSEKGESQINRSKRDDVAVNQRAMSPRKPESQVEIPSAGATTIIPSGLVSRHAAQIPPVCSDGNLACANPAPVEVTHSAYDDISKVNIPTLGDDEVVELLVSGCMKDYELEKKLGDCNRAVRLRRLYFEQLLRKKLDLIPFEHFDFGKVFGANCEIVLGYVPLPLGLVGPLTLNGQPIYIPMATTEGCLVASTNRGCKAISSSGGCFSVLLKDAITRAPCLRFPSAVRAAECKKWIQEPENYAKLEDAFNSSTNFGRLVSIDTLLAGRSAHLRFCCMSGDAMGMNMVSKGCLKAIEVLEEVFPDLSLMAISGNTCMDKKPGAINWILGRGKSVVVEAVLSEFVVQNVLKSNVKNMIETNKEKNLIGSAMAGSVGGFNAHAANIVTAVFLATGQDPAQNVESSNCITLMEYGEDGSSLHVSVTMPCIEVGTVGGGTSLPAQAGCLDICGVRGAAKGEGSTPGDNARKLAQIVAGAVLAGEISLVAALAANHLVRSHMQHNRKPQTSLENSTVLEESKTPAKELKRNLSMPDLTAFKSPALNPDVAPAKSDISKAMGK